ncbi:MAG: tonB-system energizer ExbB [Reyranella sp.]|uniref:tonB-system energizer ExbB n=1 Tax=Reyranella sp. TaxID=1929291 RepID=UPI0012084110|nr:tonB-system energizer ExbB [Reyranella sp.]TAJ87267.1 MAG: tonB-system energizer ExbB [Reyranella sp.]TBR29724.1 MAG: tonB-system energizer ExbB [Reyranella sp.]
MLLRRLLIPLLMFPSLAWAQAPAATEPAPPAESTAPATLPASTSAPDAAASTDAAPPPAPPAAAAPSQAVLPKDLSVWGMFLAADWVVQGVMIGLVVASVLTWTVFVAKTLELAMAVRRQRRLLVALDSAPSLDKAPASDLVTAAQAEQRLSADTVDDRDGVKERVASRLERLEAATGRRMLKGTGVLATIGSTAPFVGLFGTVWGIMNSFIGISRSQTTNLAVVAPGIAEALLATALGLAAAIPAVVIYNHFSRRVSAYRALVGDTSAAVLRLVSRDLGRR